MDNDNDIIDPKDLVFSQKEEPDTPIRQGFARLFADSNLDPLTNTNDLGDMDNSKGPHHRNLNGENYSFSDIDNPFMKISHKEELSQNQGMLPFIGYNQATYFNANMGFNSQNNGKPNHSQESLGLTPLRATQKDSDDYFAPYDNNLENSNSRPFGEFRNSQEFVDNNTNDYPLSLVWNHDKAFKQQATGANDLFLNERKMSFGPSFVPPTFQGSDYGEDNEGEKGHEYTDTIEIEGPNNRIFETHQDKSQKEFETFFNPRVEPSTVSSSVNNTGKKNNPKHELNQNDYRTPIQKTEGFEFRDTDKSTPLSKGEDEEDNDGIVPGSEHRSSRGLRVLSVKVKDVVGEKKRTSYKEVADDLIAEFSNKFKQRKPGEAKDEQNVKRRVYDALNVLIAADILKKDGKTVFCEEDLSNIGPSKRRNLKEEKNKIEHDIVDAKRRKKKKLDSLRELMSKCLAVKNLAERNKEKFELQSSIDQHQQVNLAIEEKPTKKKTKRSKSRAKQNSKDKQSAATLIRLKEDEVVRLPFIVLISSARENEVSLNMDNNKRELAIESKSPFNLYGDIDILLRLKLHYVSEEFFNENIPAELHKYVIRSNMHIQE